MRLYPLLSLLVFLSPLGVCQSRADVPPLITDWLKHQNNLGDVRMEFSQTKSGGALAAGVETKGEIWRSSTGSFRWKLGDPPQSTLVYDGTNLMLLESNQKAWKNVDADSQQFRHLIALLGNPDADPSSLNKDFAITQTGTGSRVHTFALVPKSRRLLKHLRQIDLQIEPKTKHLGQIRVLRTRGAETLVRFERPEKSKIDPKVFQATSE